jgi:hypothetical protein
VVDYRLTRCGVKSACVLRRQTLSFLKSREIVKWEILVQMGMGGGTSNGN